MIRRKRLHNVAPKDETEWQKKYYTHQKHWQRGKHFRILANVIIDKTKKNQKTKRVRLDRC